MQDFEDRNHPDTEDAAMESPQEKEANAAPSAQSEDARAMNEAADESDVTETAENAAFSPEAPDAQRDYAPEGARQDGYPYGGGAYPYGGYPYGGGNPQKPRQEYAYEEGSAAPARKKGLGGKIFIIVAVVILAAVLGLIIFGVINRGFVSESKKEETGTIDNVDEVVTDATPDAAPVENKTAETMTPNEIYKKVLPSSVGILVYSSNKKLVSEGSGVVFREDNAGEYTYVVTCAHVISDKGTTIMVQTADEKEYAASVVGYDNKTDIGVVRVKANGLTACEFGDSQKLEVGDTVYAIGNPGGTEFANSFTSGMISAIDRPVSSSSTGYTMECIQHTAAINPGNSGGALVNGFGQVIGINSMKIVSDEYEGMGFSVPSSVFVDIVNDIISNGYVTNRPKIGITYLPASSEQAYAMFVAIKGLPAGSIIVYSIASDSSLADTDLQKGDMIVSVDGKDLTSSTMLAEMVEKGKLGDKFTLHVVRINSDYTYKEFDVTATLVEDKGDTNLLEEEETTTSYFDDYFGDRSENDGGYSDGGNPYEDFFREFFGTP